MMNRTLDNEHEDGEMIIHVLDLPQIYLKPKPDELLDTLDLLAETTSGFGRTQNHKSRVVDPTGVPRYLTSIISSSLDWISDDDVKEQVWSLASIRLNERSGSHAAPNQTRCFEINDQVEIRLHEPSLTEDNLGFKTWASALLMSKRLGVLNDHAQGQGVRILELGAGTGLVGISAACLWGASVTLTDLPEILPNLASNVQLNASMIALKGGSAQARALDWSDSADQPRDEKEKYQIILAADPIYSPEHPQMLADTIRRWLSNKQRSRVMIELPLREHYTAERQHLLALLKEVGLSLMIEGSESGYDDWHNADGSAMEVSCWFGVWQWGKGVG